MLTKAPTWLAKLPLLYTGLVSSEQSMVFAFVNGCFVGVHTAQNPSEDEWTRHCRVIERLRHETCGVLVYTQGGGPNSVQRQEMRRALHEQPAPPVAILTGSSLVRGIITSLNWFLGNQVKAFEPEDLQAALNYLDRGGQLPSREEIERALASGAKQLSLSYPPKQSAARHDAHH